MARKRLEEPGILGVEGAHVVEPVGYDHDRDDLPALAQWRRHGVEMPRPAKVGVRLTVAALGESQDVSLRSRLPPRRRSGRRWFLVPHDDLGVTGPQQRPGLALHRLDHGLVLQRPVDQAEVKS